MRTSIATTLVTLVAALGLISCTRAERNPAGTTYTTDANNSSSDMPQSDRPDPASLNNRGSFQTGNTQGPDSSKETSSGTTTDRDRSPVTGTAGTSGSGTGSADPTYGGSTGTTENTASPYDQEGKPKAKAQVNDKKADAKSKR